MRRFRLTLLVGGDHLGVAYLDHATLTLDALWFSGSGAAVAVIGLHSGLTRQFYA